MRPVRGGWLALAAMAGLAAFSHVGLREAYALPGPHFDSLILTKRALQDLAFTVTGFRRVAADVAWIQFLQYLSGEQGEGDARGGRPRDLHAGHAHGEDCSHEDGHGTTAEGVRSEALRVARLDPRFVEPYYFGAGILAFDPSMRKPYEAIGLLQDGISHSPREWRLQTIMAAILYKVQDKPGPMIAELEKLAAAPDCPGLMRAILANIYKEAGRYRKAIEIWELVLESPSPSGERERAEREIRELLELLGESRGGKLP